MMQAMNAANVRMAVFASGNGSNFQAIIDAVQTKQIPAELVLLVCDRASAYAIERAKAAGIPVYVFRGKDFESREAADLAIVEQLRAYAVEWIVLAGYMRLLSERFVNAYAGRIVNIHPSLLPAFPGVDAIGQAHRYGVKYTGVTVHLVEVEMDAGPIIAQAVVDVESDDSVEQLAKKIHAAEHELYPRVLRWISEGRLVVDGRVCRIIE